MMPFDPIVIGVQMRAVQQNLRHWAEDLFGYFTATTKRTRMLRFIEEAAELVQAGGLNRADVDQVLDMVFSRDLGEFGQEIGGTMVTLLLLAETEGYNVGDELVRENNRIHTPEVMEKCRRRQAEKKARGL